jgi:hypothetical protein
MSTTWGTTEISLQCGIDVSQSPATVTKDTASVTLTWTVYVKAYYAFEDPQILTLSNALSTTKNYYLSAPDYPSVTTYKIGSWTQTVNTSYSGTVSKTLVAGISNVWNGATPGHSRTITIAKRPPQVPSPATSITAALSGTTTANISWVRPSNASSASNIWENVVVQRSVNGGAYSTLTTLAGTATSHQNTGLLANTTYTYRVYATNDSGSSTTVTSSTLQTTLPIPTSITPAQSATVTVPNPTLGGTFSTIVGGTGKLEWQLATDNQFTTNYNVVTESDADLTASGTHTETVSIANLSLSNGTWYIRAHVVDNGGLDGPWSATQSFTVNVPALPAPTAVTPASGATVTTMRPTLGATITVDTAGRSSKAEWQLATNSGFTTNLRIVTEGSVDFRASGATTEVVPVDDQISMDLATTWYIRGRQIGNDGSVSAWTAGTSFTLSVTAPPTPTAITPATGGPTLVTNTPTLGATLGAATESRTTKAEWQIATDTGFTTNLRTVTQSDTKLRTSGATTEVVPTASKLTQTTWYLRARAIDQYGQAGSWSAYTTFVVSHPPTALTRTPANDATILYAATTPFGWTFTDLSSTDTQTAYQVIVERNDTGASVLDTGKVTSTANSANLAISSSYKDIKLRWKVRLYDNDNVVGAYSSYSLITLSDVPTVTITAPTEAQVLNSGQPTFTWTDDANTTQYSRRVVVVRTSDGVTVHDSGTTVTTSQSYTPPAPILENNGSYSVTITVTDTVGMSGSATANFSAQYLAPDSVTFLVDESNFDELGYVYIDWNQTTPDGFFVAWTVYRRPVMEITWDLIFSTTDAELRVYHDWVVPAAGIFEYAVTQSGGRYGSVVESPIVQTESRPLEGTHYWIINPLDETDNLRLSNVTADDYTDDYDEAELVIIGRGRKVNHGTRIGYTGTLNAQLRDDDNTSARQKRVQLQALKAARTTYYLRNPFGDLLEIAIGNLGISRLAGVGTAEFVDVTIPYREVF